MYWTQWWTRFTILKFLAFPIAWIWPLYKRENDKKFCSDDKAEELLWKIKVAHLIVLNKHPVYMQLALDWSHSLLFGQSDLNTVGDCYLYKEKGEIHALQRARYSGTLIGQNQLHVFTFIIEVSHGFADIRGNLLHFHIFRQGHFVHLLQKLVLLRGTLNRK